MIRTIINPDPTPGAATYALHDFERDRFVFYPLPGMGASVAALKIRDAMNRGPVPQPFDEAES
jgi:hypothetical protein